MGPCVLAAGLEGRCPDGISSFCDDYVAESVHRQAQDRLAGTTCAQPNAANGPFRPTHASLIQNSHQVDTEFGFCLYVPMVKSDSALCLSMCVCVRRGQGDVSSDRGRGSAATPVQAPLHSSTPLTTRQVNATQNTILRTVRFDNFGLETYPPCNKSPTLTDPLCFAYRLPLSVPATTSSAPCAR